jgi:hypothetical protein
MDGARGSIHGLGAHLIVVIDQCNGLAGPDASDEGVGFAEAVFEFLIGEDRVIDLAAEGLLGLAELEGQFGLVGFADVEQVDVAGGVGFIFGEGAEEPGLLNAGDGLEGVAQFRLDSDGALEQGEDGLEVGVVAIDGVVELAALGFSAEQSFAGQAGELAGEIGGVGGEGDGELADVDACGTVDVEERQELAAEVGAEGERCSTMLLQ